MVTATQTKSGAGSELCSPSAPPCRGGTRPPSAVHAVATLPGPPPRQSQSACTPVWHLVHFFRACCAAPCPHPRALHTQGRHHLNNAIFWPWGRLVALARRAQLDASGTPRRHVPEQTRNARRDALARLASARECSRVLVNADAPHKTARHTAQHGASWASPTVEWCVSGGYAAARVRRCVEDPRTSCAGRTWRRQWLSRSSASTWRHAAFP